MKRKIIKTFLKLILILLLIIIISGTIFIIDGFCEKKVVDDLTTSFVQRGEFVYETIDRRSDYTYKRQYYKVVKEYDYEEVDDDERFVFDYNDPYKFIGAKTDIIITNRNPLRDEFISPFIGFFAKNFYLGHASMNVTNKEQIDGKETIEVVGKGENDKVRYWPNDWFYDAPEAPRIICLRLKNTTIESREDIIKEMESLIGIPYNYTFAFNTRKSYYCTDLMSRPLKKFDYNLNKDGFFTLGNDLIVSKDVYFIFYREEIRSENEVLQKIYYLSEE